MARVSQHACGTEPVGLSRVESEDEWRSDGGVIPLVSFSCGPLHIALTTLQGSYRTLLCLSQEDQNCLFPPTHSLALLPARLSSCCRGWESSGEGELEVREEREEGGRLEKVTSV